MVLYVEVGNWIDTRVKPKLKEKLRLRKMRRVLTRQPSICMVGSFSRRKVYQDPSSCYGKMRECGFQVAV